MDVPVKGGLGGDRSVLDSVNDNILVVIYIQYHILVLQAITIGETAK